jgi:hypothetical protein
VDTTLTEVILFAASAVTALIAAVRNDWLPKVEKVALAICFAATAFLLQFFQRLGN